MTTTLDFTRRVDLLRERRQELNVFPPDTVLEEQRALFRRSCAWGGAIVVGMAALGLGIALRHQLVLASIDRAMIVEEERLRLQKELETRRAQLQPLLASNTALAKALATTPSGAALMRDLQERLPQGVRLRDLKLNGADLILVGEAQDPSSFVRINAFQLQLAQSPLLSDPKLTKASRNPTAGPKPASPSLVAFEIQARLRDLAGTPALEPTLRRLGADGMAKRLQLMRQEGLLR